MVTLLHQGCKSMQATSRCLDDKEVVCARLTHTEKVAFMPTLSG